LAHVARISHGSSRDRNDAPLPKIWTLRLLARTNANDGGVNEQARGRQQILPRRSAGQAVEVIAMSSPEELTLLVGGWLRPVVAVLHLVRRFRSAPTSSREQGSTAPDR
jgi:hypothetical protein